MVDLTEKEYQTFKELSIKNGTEYETEEEYRESARSLVRLAELAYEVAKEQLMRDRRLEKEPGGFIFDGEGRSCCLCGSCVVGDMWYDKWGMQCMNCHEAYRRKLIPGYIFKDRDHQKHTTDRRLSWQLDIRSSTIQKLVREGKLRARSVPGGLLIFLKNENPDLLAIIDEEKARIASRKKYKNTSA